MLNFELQLFIARLLLSLHYYFSPYSVVPISARLLRSPSQNAPVVTTLPRHTIVYLRTMTEGSWKEVVYIEPQLNYQIRSITGYIQSDKIQIFDPSKDNSERSFVFESPPAQNNPYPLMLLFLNSAGSFTALSNHCEGFHTYTGRFSRSRDMLLLVADHDAQVPLEFPVEIRLRIMQYGLSSESTLNGCSLEYGDFGRQIYLNPEYRMRLLRLTAL